MTDVLQFPDPEKATRAILAALYPSGVTVGIGVPDGWSVGDTPHLQVALDGMDTRTGRAIAHAVIRITARADDTTAAKYLALQAEARLCAHPGGNGIISFRPRVGIIPTRDPQTRAELATFTLRATVRSVRQ